MKNPFQQNAPIPGIKHIVTVGAGKGGVGKSTVACNLAGALKLKGLKVGILDGDLYGPSISRMMGALGQKPDIDPKTGRILPIKQHGISLMSMGFLLPDDKAVIWRGPMLFKAIEQFLRDVDWGRLDVLVVDLPPGTGDVALTLAQKAPVSGGVVVCTPQNIALDDVKKALNMLVHLKIPVLGVVENMHSFQINQDSDPIDLFPKGQLDVYLKEHKIPKLCQIPFYPHIALSSEAGIPFVESADCKKEGAVFCDLADSVFQSLKKFIERKDK